MICIELGGVIEIAKENAHQTFSRRVFKVQTSHLILVSLYMVLGDGIINSVLEKFH